MTELLERALAAARSLPPEVQDDIARLVLTYAGEEPSVFILSDEERADIADADAEIARGEFATDDHIEAIWAKPRP